MLKAGRRRQVLIGCWRFMLYAFLGLLLEVTLGAVISLSEGKYTLRGNTSLWMLLDYGLFGVILMPIKQRLVLFRLPLLIRGIIYMLLIYAVEYLSGTLFTAFGLHIWSYHHHQYHLHGQIALNYAPLWYCLGLFAELIYGRIDACAQILSAPVKRSEENSKSGSPNRH
jgi:uncharacterized membrane protein